MSNNLKPYWAHDNAIWEWDPGTGYHKPVYKADDVDALIHEALALAKMVVENEKDIDWGIIEQAAQRFIETYEAKT